MASGEYSCISLAATTKSCLSDYLGAFDDLTLALVREPGNQQVLRARRGIPYRLDETTKALELHQIIIEHEKKLMDAFSGGHQLMQLKINLAGAYIARSDTHAKRGDVISQLADLATAIEVFPKYALERRVNVFLSMKRYDDAIADQTSYIEVIKDQYGKWSAKQTSYQYVRRGQFHISAGRYQAAIADFEIAVRLDPEKQEAIEKLIAATKEKQVLPIR